MERIVIYASEIAKLIRCTDFARNDIANTVETIWKRNRPHTYKSNNARKMVRNINSLIYQNRVNEQIETKSTMTVDDMKEVSESYKTIVELKESRDKAELKDIISSLLNNNHMSENEKNDLIKDIVKESELVLSDDNKPILERIDESKLKDKKHIIDYYDGMARKALGSVEESNVPELYRKKTGRHILENNTKTFQKKYKTAKDYHFEIRGKIDGLVTKFDEKQKPYHTLIEIKNRTNSLFNRIPFYEKIQLEFYLKMLNLEEAELVERLSDNINVLSYSRNEDTYRKTLKSLSKSIDFIVELWSDPEKIISYHNLSLDERNEYLNSNMPKTC